MRRPRPILVGACLAAAVTMACADSEPAGSSGERIVIGDTTFVVAGDPVWGDSVQLIEEMSFGVLEGAPEYEFGAFLDLAVDGSNGVYVFDGQVPVLRLYDSTGVYVRTLGGEGAGPGEYQDQTLGLTVRQSDGRVVVRDPGNARLNVYNADGSPHASWPVASVLFTARAMIRDTADHLYLKILSGPIVPGESWPLGLLHLDAEGQIVDTLSSPTLPGEPASSEGAFDPAKVWDFSPLGGFWAGVSDEYVIEHHRPDGTVLRVRRDLEAISLQREERSEWVALSERRARSEGRDALPIPTEKPFYRSIVVGEDGRLWVRLFAAAEKDEGPSGSAPAAMETAPPRTWREPAIYDVFEPDGTYLGQIRLPPRTTLSVRSGDRVWGVRRDELGTPQVVRFRIQGTPVG